MKKEYTNYTEKIENSKYNLIHSLITGFLMIILLVFFSYLALQIKINTWQNITLKIICIFVSLRAICHLVSYCNDAVYDYYGKTWINDIILILTDKYNKFSTNLLW